MNLSLGHVSAILAFSLWGLFPIYWKMFTNVPAWDLFAHRLLWSFITLSIIIGLRKKMPEMRAIFTNKKTMFLLMASSLLISTNWLLYIYAVNAGKILEASMGYFLNPLINILIGWLFLKEKIRTFQWPSVALVIISIAMIAYQTDLTHFPWLAISLSITFALYGLIRKIAHVGSIEGLYFETGFIVVPVLLYWGFQDSSILTAYELTSPLKFFALTLSGIITAIPLVLFAYSAKRLPLQTMAFCQYLSPSLKFVCGIFIFNEALSHERLNAFILIWLALILYSFESVLHIRKKQTIVITAE